MSPATALGLVVSPGDSPTNPGEQAAFKTEKSPSNRAGLQLSYSYQWLKNSREPLCTSRWRGCHGGVLFSGCVFAGSPNDELGADGSFMRVTEGNGKNSSSGITPLQGKRTSCPLHEESADPAAQKTQTVTNQQLLPEKRLVFSKTRSFA